MSAGVPFAEATAKDFMMVRAALVHRLGGADQALVWSRIYYRCDEDSRVAHEVDGVHWWRASHAVLAKETGLSEKQARTAIDVLVADGFVQRERFGGRTFSYRPVTYLPIRADGESAHMGTSIRPDGQINLPDPAIAPLIETGDIEDPVAPPGAPVATFDDFYFAYPRKVGRAAAQRAFAKAAKTTDPAVIVAGARRYAADPNLPDKQFIPHPSSWLNAGRWDDEAEVARDGGHRPAIAAEDEWMFR